MGSTPLQDRSSIRFTLAVAFLPTGISAISGICPDRQELLPTASAGVRSTFGTLFKAFPQVQHLVAAGLEAAIFAVSGLGVDDLAAVFTLDSAHTGVAINEIFHQGVLIFAFPLFCCHRHPPLVLWVYGGYQNGNSHFRTIKRCECLVDGQNDHQPESVRYS